LIFFTMSFADCPTPAIVMNAAAYSISGANQKLYSRLKTSLQLNLRRQIFLAVCDDLELRSYLVAQLQIALRSPRVVSLNLNLSDPNPMAQVAQWLSLHNNSSDTSHSPGFQILGVEHLTRQPAPVQKRFLTHLQAIEYYLPGIDGTIVLWLPRPWLRSLQQSAPAFWDWHTALFEFEGDPAPLRSISQSRLSSDRTLDPAIASLQTASTPTSTPQTSTPQTSTPHSSYPHLSPVVPIPHTETFTDSAPVEESIWDMLIYDLAQLDAGSQQRNEAEYKITEALVDEASANNLQNSKLKTQNIPCGNATRTKLKTSLASTSRLTQQILAAIAQEPALAEHQTALRNLQQIDQLLEQRAAQKTIAAAYRDLGRLYQNRLEQGNPSPKTLDIAIAIHEEALEWLQDDTLQWVDGANDLGNLYWMQSHSAGTADLPHQISSLQKAIRIYTLALDKTTPQANSHTYAMIQNNLGSAYGDLAHYQNPANNLLKSVEAYESALHYCDPQENMARNAATQNNLGTACWNLAQHQQPIVRLNQAIAAYHAALQYYSPNSEPMHYAMIQNNLGTAYWNLAQHLKPNPNPNLAHSTVSPTRLLQLAIAAYHTALHYRTLDTVPASFAATQNNLGTAYWNLANLKTISHGDRPQYLQQAIKAYEAAIAAVDLLSAQTDCRPALSFDVSATYNNLGLSYYQLAGDQHTSLTSPQRQTLLESALTQHLQALQGWEPLSDFYQTTLDYIIQATRAFHSEFGIQGQILALSKIPANLLPEVMRKL
jgi:tetratricopeptide (TPR) repeat protein